MSAAATFAVRITPRAGHDTVDGPTDDGTLRVRVTAAPADGAANRALIKLVASSLGVPKSSVTIVSGATARHKRLRVAGLEATVLRARWPGLRAVD